MLLLLVARALPPGGRRLRIATLAVLNVGLFFVLLLIAAERLPGGVAAAAGQSGRSSCAARLAGSGHPTHLIALATGALGVVGVGALVLGLAASLDTIFGRPPLSLVSLTAWQLTIGGVLVAPFALVFEGLPPVPTAANLAGFGLTGPFGRAVAYALWIRGVSELPAAALVIIAVIAGQRVDGPPEARTRARRSACGLDARCDAGSALTRDRPRRHPCMAEGSHCASHDLVSIVPERCETAHISLAERLTMQSSRQNFRQNGHNCVATLDNWHWLHYCLTQPRQVAARRCASAPSPAPAPSRCPAFRTQP